MLYIARSKYVGDIVLGDLPESADYFVSDKKRPWGMRGPSPSAGSNWPKAMPIGDPIIER